jgi:hypothetical protein
MRASLVVALLALGGTATLPAQEARPLAIRVAVGGAALHVGPVLGDRELEGAARSGLPIRVHARVELWRDEFADDLVESRAWTTVLAYEPLTRRFFVRSTAGNVQSLVFATFAAAREAIEREYPLRTTVRREGRYYYRASVEIQTLSASDLKELERWLQGDLQPAVEGGQSLPGALGEGAKRLLIRVLGVPNRSYEARSDRFRIGS